MKPNKIQMTASYHARRQTAVRSDAKCRRLNYHQRCDPILQEGWSLNQRQGQNRWPDNERSGQLYRTNSGIRQPAVTSPLPSGHHPNEWEIHGRRPEDFDLPADASMVGAPSSGKKRGSQQQQQLTVDWVDTTNVATFVNVCNVVNFKEKRRLWLNKKQINLIKNVPMLQKIHHFTWTTEYRKIFWNKKGCWCEFT